MTCARCGCGVYEAENQITLNKIWHKCCFCCRNCNKRLDKCTANVFHGDIYCKVCYENIVEDADKLSAPYCKPCRVVSSPSCVCLKKTANIPTFDYCKKYNICFRPEQKSKKPKISQSCSCLVGSKKSNHSYCFAFPIPREVANYYNRANMRKNKNQCSKLPNCQNNESCRRPTYIRVRDISPQHKKRPLGYRSPSPKPRRCCWCCAPPPSCPPKANCCCCANKPRCRSPPRRNASPLRCFTRPPAPCTCKQQCSCSSEESRPADCARRAMEKSAKYCCCGRNNPCNCKMSQIRAICTSVCVRCGHKVYAAEKISVSNGSYHNSCFSCYCCHKLLDVRNVYENGDEIYCKNCYNNFFGTSYYGYC